MSKDHNPPGIWPPQPCQHTDETQIPCGNPARPYYIYRLATLEELQKRELEIYPVTVTPHYYCDECVQQLNREKPFIYQRIFSPRELIAFKRQGKVMGLQYGDVK